MEKLNSLNLNLDESVHFALLEVNFLKNTIKFYPNHSFE